MGSTARSRTSGHFVLKLQGAYLVAAGMGQEDFSGRTATESKGRERMRDNPYKDLPLDGTLEAEIFRYKELSIML